MSVPSLQDGNDPGQLEGRPSMDANPSNIARHLRPLTYVAAGLSIVLSGLWWFFLTGQNSGFYPGFFEYSYPFALVDLALAAVVAMVLNIVAGWRGGVDRRVAIIAGVILLLPGAYFVIGNLIGIFLL
jgi:hypothetical protein